MPVPIVEKAKTTTYDLTKNLNLTVKAQRKNILLNSRQEQVMPMLINLKALDVTQDQLSKRAPIDLFCIIDRSGSMSG